MPLNIKDLRPHVFEADPESIKARKQWNHWYKLFSCYIGKHEDISESRQVESPY